MWTPSLLQRVELSLSPILLFHNQHWYLYMIIIYTCGSSQGKQILLEHTKQVHGLCTSIALQVWYFSIFSSEGTLCLALCLFSVLRTTKMSQAESSCNAGMSDLLQQVWKKRNVIYYSLFTSATITLQNQKENNVIERYMPSSLQKPQTASGKSQYRCSTRH